MASQLLRVSVATGNQIKPCSHLSGCPPRREVTHDTAAVLHFTFNRFADLKARRDRCDCAPTEADAKRCFILPFDRMVHLTLT